MILDFFPPPYQPREIQRSALEQVEAAFASGKQFVLLEAPPGAGKSHIAATLARRYGKAWVLTKTKQLQDQYIELFHGIGARELKGRVSFDCEKAKGTCEDGADFETACPLDPKPEYEFGPCPYKVAKEAAMAAQIAVCNYHSYFWNVNYKVGGVRPLVILDEGHEAEEVLMDFISVTVASSKIPIHVDMPFPNADDVDACFDWLEEFLVTAEETDPDDLDKKKRKEFDALVKKATYAVQIREKERWISEPLDRVTGFALKPLTVKSFGERLFRFGEKVVIMSATILDPDKVAGSLGIKDYAFVQSPCPFPKENRPVIAGSLNMTKAHRDRSWPAMIEQMEAILDGHAEEKGLILTPSNEMLNYIQKQLPKKLSNRLILAHGKTRAVSYQQHVDSQEPSVLAASGYWEGADLKDDLSRFQIIPAIPRPFWGGQIAARAQMDRRWYRWRSYTQLIQGVGRSVRSETDTAVTYVLDGDLREEANRNDTMLPGWFREAMEYA